MKGEEIIGMLKSYIKKTLVGMGALKGAPCTVKSVEEDPGVHVITLEWTDNDGNKQTTAITVLDGTDGTDGFSPEVTVKASTDSTYILTITTKDGSYDTPNLKGGGSGGSSSMADLEDVQLVSLSADQVLKWDAVNEKWVNASLGTAAAKNATNAVTEGSSALLESGAAFTALADKADKSDTYTKTQTDNAITAEIENLDVNDSATAGSYVTAVSETDGKISVTREAADAAPTSGSNKLVNSGGVFDANQSINELIGKNWAGGGKNLWANGNISGTAYVSVNLKKQIPAGTYTFSAVVNSSDVDAAACLVNDITNNIQLGLIARSTGTERKSITFTLAQPTSEIALYASITYAQSTGDTFSFEDIQIEEGTTATSYAQFAKDNAQLTAEQGYITDDQWTAINGLYT